MLLTTCPTCAAQFKVQPEQLNIRQGRVMCGRCRHVFNAFESLQRTETDGHDDHQAIDSSLIESAPEAEAEFSSTFTTSEPPVPEELLGAGSPGENTDPSAATFASAPATDHAVTGGAQSYRDADHVYLSEKNSLLLSSSERRTSTSGSSRLWAYLLALAVVAIALQGLYFFRDTVVQAYPQARPYFTSICEMTACKLSWGRDDSAIKIGLSDLVEPPGKPGRILLTATLVNRARVKLDLPAVELRLTDNADQVLISRILTPADYLGRPLMKEEGLAAGAELFISLALEVANKMPASGYTLRPFYP